MRFNFDQIKHIAKIFDVLALAAIAPVIAEITNIREIPAFSTWDILIFSIIAVTLESVAIGTLGTTKHDSN